VLLAPLSGEKKGSSKKSQVLQRSGKWQCCGTTQNAAASAMERSRQRGSTANAMARHMPMPWHEKTLAPPHMLIVARYGCVTCYGCKTKTGHGNGAVHQKNKQHNQPGGGVQQWRCSSRQLLITLLLPRGIATTAAPPPTPQNDCCIFFFLLTRHRCAATTETPPPALQVDCF